MSQILVDANVLIAMCWPTHSSHAAALGWFSENAQRGWATCPITQTAFVRIVSNPAFSSDALTPGQALAVLEANTTHPDHEFWPDDLSLSEALRGSADILTGHRQVTDAYLLALAGRRRGAFATFDRGTLQVAKTLGVRVELIKS